MANLSIGQESALFVPDEGNTREDINQMIYNRLNRDEQVEFLSSQNFIDFLRTAFAKGDIWLGINKKDYRTLRNEMLNQLSQYPELKSDELKKVCSSVISEANAIYNLAAGNKPEVERTIYHGTDQGAGHIEMVMTNTLISVAAAKNLLRDYMNKQLLPEEQTLYHDFFTKQFGTNWQETIGRLNFNQLHRMLVYAAFHEAGEWWVRMVDDPNKLLGYQDAINQAVNRLMPDESEPLKLCRYQVKFRKEAYDASKPNQGVKVISSYPKLFNLDLDPDLISRWPFSKDQTSGFFQVNRQWLEELLSIKKKQTTDQKELQELSKIDLDKLFTQEDKLILWGESVFGVLLHPKQHQDDLDFTKIIKMEENGHHRGDGTNTTDDEILVMARILRAADLMQIFDRFYQKKFKVKILDRPESIEVQLGPALLYYELLQYMPHAIQAYNWEGGVFTSFTSKDFIEKIVLGNNLPKLWLMLFDKYQVAEGRYYQSTTDRIIQEAEDKTKTA